MSELIFDERVLIDDNIFKFEQRLQTHVNRFVENGAIFTDYFNLDDDSSTVDRGTRTIDELFGKNSPLRYNEIIDFPVYGFGQANPDNTDEAQIEDFNVEGDCVILPSTIVPKQFDFFIVKHLKMIALFEVTTVTNDSMKTNGYYKIHYRLHSTSQEFIDNLRNRVNQRYHTDMNEVGGHMDPIIKEDDFILREKIKKMTYKMISAYRALFYNERHNCFIYRDQENGIDLFDMCGNEFMAKYSLMNSEGSSSVIILNEKIRDPQYPLYYNNSIYNWLEMGAPTRMLQRFFYILNDSGGYPYSSFAQWDDNVMIIQPLATHQVGKFVTDSFFDENQFNCLLDPKNEPSSDYEKLIWKYVHKENIKIQDISLYTGDAVINAVRHIDTFLYTPIIIFIIREIIGMN